MPTIYIDADGCPVKNEVYRVAARYDLAVIVVANSYQSVPQSDRIQGIIVGKAFDAADDWIADRAGEGDIVVTADIPLASRCIKGGARVLGPKGREFSEVSIGDALASREISQYLRDMGVATGGPKPFSDRDRSHFLSRLDEIVNAVIRESK